MYSKLISWCAIGLLSVSTAVATPPAWEHTLLEDRQMPSNRCAPNGVHVVAQPGAHKGGTHYSRIGTLVTNITSMIPGSNSYLTGPYGSGSFIRQTERVGKQLRFYLHDYHKKCPTTKIVLVGYSNGAVTTMNVLCGASPVPPWVASKALVHKYPIIAAVGYGDETYAANRPYNVATCKANAPNGHRTNVTACKSFFSSIQSYCIAQDSECCGTGHNYSAHFIYQKFDVQAAKFVHSKWVASNSEEK